MHNRKLSQSRLPVKRTTRPAKLFRNRFSRYREIKICNPPEVADYVTAENYTAGNGGTWSSQWRTTEIMEGQNHGVGEILISLGVYIKKILKR